MLELNIEYNTFKTIMLKYNMSVYFIDNNIGYQLYMSATDFVYISEIYSESNKLDFDSNYKAISTQASSRDEALALVVVPYKWSESSRLVAQKGVYVDGNSVIIQPGQNSGSCSWQYSVPIELQGVDVIIDNPGARFGDEAIMIVEHPVYGEVYRFGNNVKVLGASLYTVLPEVVAPLPAGLIITCLFKAVDSDGRKIAINLRCYK